MVYLETMLLFTICKTLLFSQCTTVPETLGRVRVSIWPRDSDTVATLVISAYIQMSCVSIFTAIPATSE